MYIANGHADPNRTASRQAVKAIDRRFWFRVATEVNLTNPLIQHVTAAGCLAEFVRFLIEQCEKVVGNAGLTPPL
jgi:hypothetical protein